MPAVWGRARALWPKPVSNPTRWEARPESTSIELAGEDCHSPNPKNNALPWQEHELLLGQALRI